MKSVHYNFSKALSRRSFLKGAGAAMALPWLEAMVPAFASALQRQGLETDQFATSTGTMSGLEMI